MELFEILLKYAETFSIDLSIDKYHIGTEILERTHKNKALNSIILDAHFSFTAADDSVGIETCVQYGRTLWLDVFFYYLHC